MTAFRGFVVAVGSGGIQALQVICDDSAKSRWVGNPKTLPVTERLLRATCITALEVGFDVSLAVVSIIKIHTKY